MKDKFISHSACVKCGSSDGVGWYADGHGYCFVCTKHYRGKGDLRDDIPNSNSATYNRDNRASVAAKPLTPITTVFRGIPKRGLPEEAIRKFQIDVCMDKSKDIARRYPYYKNGVHTANKVRQRTKKHFWWEGDESGTDLFGQHLFPVGSARAVTVVEGEDDAASAWVLLGSRYPVVSIKSASRAVEDCRAAYEYLNSFDEIVLCFDKDEPHYRPDRSVFHPGQEAAKAVAELFAPGKCRLMELQEGKDASEYLQREIPHKTFVNEWYRAKKFMPDGLVFGHDLWDSIISSPKPYCVPTGIKGVDDLIYGLRLGEMVTFTADPKIGKTTVLKTIEYALLMHPELREKEYGVGFMHLEEPKQDLAVGLMGLHVGKRLNLPDTPTSEEELSLAFNEVINSPRVVVWDHFGTNSVDAVVNKVRHMAALGCKYIVLDHFSMLASDQSTDERKKLDEIATKLKTLTVELNICLMGVIHQNRQGQIRGTAAFEQLSNIVIRLERDKLAKDSWRRNVMVVTVTENRFSGRTGPAAYLFYDDTSGKFEEIEDEETISKYEEGRSISDANVDW